MFKTRKPTAASWRTAKLYQADFYNVKWPVCGSRLVWAVVGHKWVRLCTPVQNDKWRMRRADWDGLSGVRLIR
mgnify:CR=1 FL=1